jgi:iron complex transport system permease protein
MEKETYHKDFQKLSKNKDKSIFLKVFLIISIVILAASFLAALCFGAEKINLSQAFAWARDPSSSDKFSQIIIWQLRLPRALLVLLTGILLGGSGAVFQLFFRNPLAEPGIMGISSGATLGAVTASTIIAATASQSVATISQNATSSVLSKGIFAFISPVNFCAFVGALLAGAFVTVLAFTRSGKNSSIMLLLCGTALGTLYSAISSIIILSSSKELHSIYTWILGSFNGRGWKELLFILPASIISVVIMMIISKPLDLLTCGEKTASSLGVQVDKLRILVLICGALAVSAAVCAGGTIGFVGLIAPHIVRKITGPKSRTLIPFSMLFGAILMLLSDTLARTVIAPSELPAGIITSILGVPFFVSLCLKK